MIQLVNRKYIEGVKCKIFPIERIGVNENDTIPDMKTFMIDKRGAGLAAPQIGINRKFFIMKYGDEIISCYNPTFKPKGQKKAVNPEGCLTYGGWKNQVDVERFKMIIAYYYNNHGLPVYQKMRGTDAIVFQHECDHLVGKTIFFDPEATS